MVYFDNINKNAYSLIVGMNKLRKPVPFCRVVFMVLLMTGHNLNPT